MSMSYMSCNSHFLFSFKEMVTNKSVFSRKICCFLFVLQCILTVTVSSPAPNVTIGKFGFVRSVVRKISSAIQIVIFSNVIKIFSYCMVKPCR